MSRPLDVLAVMDDAICAIQREYGEESTDSRGLLEARAAVAELIGRVRTVIDWCEEIEDDDSRVPRQDMAALYAALAKFGGAK